MKRNAFFALCIFLPMFSAAQNNFTEGFIISLSKDTIRGLIKEQNRVKSAKTCLFKSNEKAEIQTFKPGEIAGYGIGNQRLFKSMAVPNTGTNKHIFAECLVLGKADLFFRRDSYQENHFYIRKDRGAIYELSETDEITDGAIDTTKKYYEQFLATLFNDCDMFFAEIAQCRFSRNDLTELTAQYNKCIDDKNDFINRQKNRLFIEKGFIIGFDNAVLSFKETGNYGVETDFSLPHSFLTGGAFLELSSVWTKEVLAFRTELWLSHHSFEHNKDTTFAYTLLKIPAMIRLAYPKTKIKPYIYGGIYFAQALSIDFNFTENEKKNTIGPVIGGGLAYSINEKYAVFLEARYDNCKSLTDTFYSSVKPATKTFLIGLRF